MVKVSKKIVEMEFSEIGSGLIIKEGSLFLDKMLALNSKKKGKLHIGYITIGRLAG